MSEKKHIWTRITADWCFSLSLTAFENINQEHNLLPDCACLWTIYLCTGICEKCMSGFSAFVLTTGNILFRSMLNGNCLISSAPSS